MKLEGGGQLRGANELLRYFQCIGTRVGVALSVKLRMIVQELAPEPTLRNCWLTGFKQARQGCAKFNGNGLSI